jgi:hypothetical protein
LGAGAINSFQQAQNLADARARKLIAEERNLNTSNLDAIIKSMEEDASGVVKGLDLVGLDGTGIRKQHQNDLGGQISPATPPTSVGGSKPSGSSSSSSGSSSSSSDRDLAPTTSRRPVEKPTTVSTPAGTKTVSSTPTSSPRSYTSPTTQELRDKKAGVNVGGYNATATNRVGPQARGGLINKPQKVAKPKTKLKTKI